MKTALTSSICISLALALSPSSEVSAQVATIPERECVSGATPPAALTEAATLVTAGAYAEADAVLGNIDTAALEDPCLGYQFARLKFGAAAGSGQVIQALDVPDTLLANTPLSPSESDAWKLALAQLKYDAISADLDFSRAERRRIELDDEEWNLLEWEQFLAGTYHYDNRGRSAIAQFFSSAMVVTTGSIDNLVLSESLYQARDWEALARHVLSSRYARGFDIGYFYLAAAALGLDREDSAVTYANLALRSSNCGNRQITNGRDRVSYCYGHNVQRDAQGVLEQVQQREAERQRRLAEEERRREELALQQRQEQERQNEQMRRQEASRQALETRRTDLLKRFPEDWVTAILESSVIVGMSMEAVRESLGEPSNIEQIEPRELWHFGSSRRVIFTDGLVSFID